jgi:hypothetical protein
MGEKKSYILDHRQHHLYSTLGNKKPSQVSDMKKEALDLLIQRIVALGKVLFGLHMVIIIDIQEKEICPGYIILCNWVFQ